jgi:dinuclear metal center YbgI/SA1388 family protein
VATRVVGHRRPAPGSLSPVTATIAELSAFLNELFPPSWAADWDAVGLVCGRPETVVERVLFAVDCVPQTVSQARQIGARMLVTHHPLLLRGVSSVSPDTYKGEIVHTLIESGIGLHVAHTNADVAVPGVSDALAQRLGLQELRPLSPLDGGPRGIGRIGRLDKPMRLADFTQRVAARLPATAWGVRATGDPEATVTTVAVSGGAGDSYLALAAEAGVDAYLTADLRHHPASESAVASGPALIDAAHWATERPWLDVVAAQVRAEYDVDTVVSDRNTDPWTIHVSSTT